MAADPEIHRREMSVRRQAERHGMRASRSRARDPQAADFGLWTLTDADGALVASGSLDRVGKALTKAVRGTGRAR